MNGNIVGEEFEGYVFDQISQRQKNQFSGYTEFRTPEQLQYLNNTTAWVKLASSVEIVEERNEEGELIYNGIERLRDIIEDNTLVEQFRGIELAKKTILFNGTSETTPAEYNNGKKVEKISEYNLRAGYSKDQSIWNLSTAYGLGGPEFGQQPMPGIQSVDVKSLNRGSIREANITIKAYNKNQFAIIELLYLRIGFSMMLEWGNDKFINNKGELQQTGNTIIEDLWFQNNNYTQLKMINAIERYRGYYDGNYDGFFGKVVNFDWSFSSDGSYDITLKLVTVGDVIESLQANIPVNPSEINKINIELENDDNKVYKDLIESPIINAAKNNKIGKYLFESLTQTELWQEGENPEYFSFKYSKDASQFLDKIPTNYQYYISFGEFLNLFQNEIIPGIETGDIISPMLNIEKDEFANKISYYPNQISLDPRICIFKYYFGNVGNDDPLSQVSGLKPPPYLDSLKEYVKSTDDGVAYGKLMNIYLNYDFISKSLTADTKDGKLSIFKFFERICDGINSALGNVNNIEPIIKNDKIITFIDQNPIPGYLETLEPKNSIVDLEVYGYNESKNSANFLKNINFKTSITPQLASMITIGTTAGGSSTKNEDGTAFSNWNKGLKDRFSPRRVDPKDTMTASEKAQISRVEELIAEFDSKSYFVLFAGEDQNEDDEYKSFSKSKYKRKRRGINNPTFPLPNHSISVKDYVKAGLENDEYLKNNPSLISQSQLTQEKQTNYMLYLITAFGGSSNIKIQRVEKKSKTKEIEITPTLFRNSSYLKFEPDFISQGKNTFKTYINTLSESIYQETKTPSNQIGFIPVGFDITLQGISGIKIYNKLNINNTFLPSQYPNALKFLIQKVNHSIKDNTWETTLDTLSIPKVEVVSKEEVIRFFAELQFSQTGLLPKEERGPKPTNEPLIIYNGINTTPYTTPISIEDLIKEFNPDAQPTFRRFFNDLAQNYRGYKININAIGRSLEKSEELLNQNPNNAKPGTSRHNFFAAVDFNVITPNGVTLKKKGNKHEWVNNGFDILAEKHNLIWGGSWDGYEDCVHFGLEFPLPPVTLADLRGNNGKNINLT